MLIVLAIILVLMACGVAIMGHGASVKSTVRNGWGRDLVTITCPYCHGPLPGLRWPSSLRQAFVGGWTCSICTTKVDKSGREIGHDPDPRTGGKTSR
jgi:hypothetical protein